MSFYRKIQVILDHLYKNCHQCYPVLLGKKVFTKALQAFYDNLFLLQGLDYEKIEKVALSRAILLGWMKSLPFIRSSIYA